VADLAAWHALQKLRVGVSSATIDGVWHASHRSCATSGLCTFDGTSSRWHVEHELVGAWCSVWQSAQDALLGAAASVTGVLWHSVHGRDT
jgi:hypothetical protein